MMKKIAFYMVLILCFIIIATVSAASMVLEYDGQSHEYNGNIYSLSVNGKKILTPLEPILFNDRALVPVREVFEAAGAKVNYNNDTKGIYIAGNDMRMLMTIGSDTVTVNGTEMKIPDGVSPKLIAKSGCSAKTMVPVRFISEALGYSVDFSGTDIFIDTNVKKPLLQSLYCNNAGDAVMISIKSDRLLTSVSEPVLTSSGVLYVDIAKADSLLPTKTDINRGAVTATRVGVHDDYTRIALDVSDLKSYSVKLSKDRKIVMITTIKNASEETEKTVVIDAGHGGKDGGAGRTYNGVHYDEKDITLSVAHKTCEILQTNGVKVEMTRSGDTYPELLERSGLANSLRAAVFVSIHVNSAENVPNANGVEIYYCTQNNGDEYGVKSQELADKILNAVLTYTGANNRKVKTENHAVTRTSEMPATLVEIGFITNDIEIEKLLNDDYQYKIASGIAEGIMKCLPKITVPTGENINFGEADLGDKIA